MVHGMGRLDIGWYECDVHIGQPHVVQQHLLMGRFPQCPDFFGFMPDVKCLMLDGKGNKLRLIGEQPGKRTPASLSVSQTRRIAMAGITFDHVFKMHAFERDTGRTLL
jgi:hypothetical protein